MKQLTHENGRLKTAVVALLVAIVITAALVGASAEQRRAASPGGAGRAVLPDKAGVESGQARTATTAARVELPANPGPGSVVRSAAGIELVWIPAGEFVIGSTDQDLARIEREYSERKYNDIPTYPHDGGVKDETYAGSGRLTVRFKQGFWMARLETTQGQWKTVMGNNPSLHQGPRNRFGKDENLPVEQVSWMDAQEFIKKLNQRNDGLAYRLPTDAEWEYAARAGTTGDYAGPIDEMGWYASNSGRTPTDSLDEWKKFKRWAADAPENTMRTWRQFLEQNGNQPNPAGTKKPNAWGLYDMHGNVWEWCKDESSSYHFEVQKDGSPYLKQDEPNAFRMIRGGAFHNLAWSVRSARRIWERGDQKYDTIGFRVVAVAKQ